MEHTYDIIVIGSGPGGEGASIRAAKAGKSVAVIERHYQIGGGCTHWGTIPSKALIAIVQQYSELKGNRLFDKVLRNLRLSYDDLMNQVNAVVMQ